MKIIEWKECDTPVIIGEYKQNEEIEYHPPITEGMKFVAKYDDHGVHMIILDEITPNIFSATVDFFDSLSSELLVDLSVGDTVQIKRKNMSCIFVG